MVLYEYRYLCEYRYRLALTNSIRSAGTYAPEFAVYSYGYIHFVDLEHQDCIVVYER